MTGVVQKRKMGFLTMLTPDFYVNALGKVIQNVRETVEAYLESKGRQVGKAH
jgi:hypothetical protein